jgi:hypothetical protein
MIEKASPAVVKISMTRVIKASDQQGGGGGNPFANDLWRPRWHAEAP